MIVSFLQLRTGGDTKRENSSFLIQDLNSNKEYLNIFLLHLMFEMPRNHQVKEGWGAEVLKEEIVCYLLGLLELFISLSMASRQFEL